MQINDYKKNSFIIVSKWFLFYFRLTGVGKREKRINNKEHWECTKNAKNICHRFTDFWGLWVRDLGLGTGGMGAVNMASRLDYENFQFYNFQFKSICNVLFNLFLIAHFCNNWQKRKMTYYNRLNFLKKKLSKTMILILFVAGFNQ